MIQNVSPRMFVTRIPSTEQKFVTRNEEDALNPFCQMTAVLAGVYHCISLRVHGLPQFFGQFRDTAELEKIITIIYGII